MFNFTLPPPFATKKQKKVIVSFTGGMGAQILSAAIYFSMKTSGEEVYADLSYFDNPAMLAAEGVIGQVSKWDWQLNHFGLKRCDFKSYVGIISSKEDLISDGSRKIQLGLRALRDPEIQQYFTITTFPADTFSLDGEKYVCTHIRRGDYINVASHLMEDEDFIKATNTFSSLSDILVVVSDSIISHELKTGFSAQFKRCIFLDSTDTFTAHCIMRKANVLICSNSQFSLTAAALNKKTLALIPKNWGADVDISKTISLLGNFQTLHT